MTWRLLNAPLSGSTPYPSARRLHVGKFSERRPHFVGASCSYQVTQRGGRLKVDQAAFERASDHVECFTLSYRVARNVLGWQSGLLHARM